MVTRSLINSSLDTTRPDTELNSWRLTPLKTILLPFSIMIESFISKRRKPTLWGITSVTCPFSSITSSNRSYNTGDSADHSSGFSTFITYWDSSASVSSTLCSSFPALDNVIFTFPAFVALVSITRSALVKVSSRSVWIFTSDTWTSGIAYR